MDSDLSNAMKTKRIIKELYLHNSHNFNQILKLLKYKRPTFSHSVFGARLLS